MCQLAAATEQRRWPPKRDVLNPCGSVVPLEAAKAAAAVAVARVCALKHGSLGFVQPSAAAADGGRCRQDPADPCAYCSGTGSAW